MQKDCAHCGATYMGKTANSTYCSPKCRQAAFRSSKGAGKKAPRPKPAKAAKAQAKVAPSVPAQSVTGAVTTALSESLDTPQGQMALVLAQRMDNAEGETGAGVAAVARQLVVLLADLVEPQADSVDPLDELRQKRLQMMNA